jgi:hypothetical protein
MRVTVIIVCNQVQVTGSQFLKYRNVEMDKTRWGSFLDFAAKFPGVDHINVYNPKLPKGKNFMKQFKWDAVNSCFNAK